MEKHQGDEGIIEIIQVVDWDSNFEGAKSKTYNNKSSCTMPTKHGLGYKRIIKSKGGVALFGAWCALIQLLSRHKKPRQGFCTDTGCADGNPYTAEDLELLTDIPMSHFTDLFQIAQSVGWVRVVRFKDTMGILQEIGVSPQCPLNSNLNSNSNSNSNSMCAESEDSTQEEDSTDDPVVMIFKTTGNPKQWMLHQSKLKEWEQSYDTVDVPLQLKKARQWLEDNPTRRKTAKGMTRFLGNWFGRCISRGEVKQAGAGGSADNACPKCGADIEYADVCVCGYSKKEEL